MFNRIRSFFKSESDKLKGLTMKQKLGYVRDYYWLQISLVVIVLTLGSFVIYRVRTTLSDHWFYLMLANKPGRTPRSGRDTSITAVMTCRKS